MCSLLRSVPPLQAPGAYIEPNNAPPFAQQQQQLQPLSTFKLPCAPVSDEMCIESECTHASSLTVYDSFAAQPTQQQQQAVSEYNRRDLAYKPSIPQGWNAPAPVLPKGEWLRVAFD